MPVAACSVVNFDFEEIMGDTCDEVVDRVSKTSFWGNKKHCQGVPSTLGKRIAIMTTGVTCISLPIFTEKSAPCSCIEWQWFGFSSC